MEQEKKKGPGVFGLIVLAAAVCLSLVLSGERPRTQSVAAMAALEAQYSFEVWEAVDESHTAVRFCTSWSTTDRDVDALIADIQVL